MAAAERARSAKRPQVLLWVPSESFRWMTRCAERAVGGVVGRLDPFCCRFMVHLSFVSVVKQSKFAGWSRDSWAFALACGVLDGVEFAALDLVQHDLSGDPEAFGGLVEGDVTVWDIGVEAAEEFVGDPKR